jgi:hypothetical protein
LWNRFGIRNELEWDVKGLLGEVAWAGTGKFVCVNEEPPIGITWVNREHTVVHILLGALALVAGGEQTAGRVRVLASLKTGGLGVVVVAITIALGDVLQDDPPVALNIDSTGDLGIVHITGAKVALWSNPVSSIIRGISLASSSVVAIIKSLLLLLGDVLHQVISWLVSNVSVFLKEESILRYLVSNIICRVLSILNTVGKVTAFSTLGCSLRVTVSILRGRGRVGRDIGGRMRNWEGCPDDSRRKDCECCNL